MLCVCCLCIDMCAFAQFADYGKDRQASVMYHLEQLRMLLLPTQVTKMCMWSLHQDDDFYDEEQNQTSWGGGIWNILCKELKVRRILGLSSWVLGLWPGSLGPGSLGPDSWGAV